MTHIMPNPILPKDYNTWIWDPPPYVPPREWYYPYPTPRDPNELTITVQELMKAEAAQAEKDKRIITLEKEIKTLEEALVEAEQEVLIREARIDILLSLLHNVTEPKVDLRENEPQQLELPLVAR